MTSTSVEALTYSSDSLCQSEDSDIISLYCFISISVKLVTAFIRLSARGAYLIFGLSGWALIQGGRLFEAGRLLIE